jgi:hypothetical protein
MDAFVFRKRKFSDSRRTTPSRLPSPIADSSSSNALEDSESTEFKLAMLSSLHPHVEQQTLLDVLLAHDGSVEEASASLKNPESPQKRPAVIGYQSSLSAFVAPAADTDNTLKKTKLLSKRGKTLHLYSPEDVAKHTPCSIIHNFLPAEEANALLEELLLEAVTFERMSFKLFDNVVQSPHTSCFYVGGSEEQIMQKTEYIYNGGLVEVGCFLVHEAFYTFPSFKPYHIHKNYPKESTSQVAILIDLTQ